MALVNKQDSNFTELRYAVEESPGVLPTTPEWIQVEPNEYKDFGGTVKTKARNPINASRQRKKGVVIDIDASSGFVQDVTPTNSKGFMSAFLFAAARDKDTDDVATINTNRYVVAAGGLDYRAQDLIFADDFDLTANEGLNKVTASDATHVSVAALTDATGQDGVITRVGIEFGSGAAAINATTSEFPRLELTGNVAATGTLDITGDAIADGDVVTVGGVAYTFESGTIDAGTTTAVEVDLGVDDAGSLANLVKAINLTGISGTDYGSANIQNPKVSAAVTATDVVTFTAREVGTPGNLIALSTTITGATVSGAFLASGAGRDLSYLGLIPGEFVFLGSEVTDTSFGTDEDNGFCRIRSIEPSALVFDKTQFIMTDDAGSAKTVRMFFGSVIKNESERTLIIKRSLQFERSLGAPDDSVPSQIQGEYVTRCMADEATIDGKTADILKLEASFLGGTSEVVTGAEGLKSGTRPELVESDAFNTTSDVTLIKMAVVTDGDSCPTPLFAYLTDLKLSIKNNIKQNKAISVLGSFDVTPGQFEVSGDVTAYFQTVTAISLVQANTSVTLEAHFVKENQGLTVDVPLITLSKAMPEVKQDEAIMLPLSSDAATAKLIDPDLDYTLLTVYWPYLPDTAQ